MGDRIAVMRKGVLQQIGTPEELYISPVEHVRRDVHRVAGDEPAAARRRSESAPTASSPASGPSTSISATAARTAAHYNALVEVVEYLGDEQLAHLRLGDARIVAKLPVEPRLADGNRAGVLRPAAEGDPLRRGERALARGSSLSPDVAEGSRRLDVLRLRRARRRRRHCGRIRVLRVRYALSVALGPDARRRTAGGALARPAGAAPRGLRACATRSSPASSRTSSRSSGSGSSATPWRSASRSRTTDAAASKSSSRSRSRPTSRTSSRSRSSTRTSAIRARATLPAPRPLEWDGEHNTLRLRRRRAIRRGRSCISRDPLRERRGSAFALDLEPRRALGAACRRAATSERRAAPLEGSSFARIAEQERAAPTTSHAAWRRLAPRLRFVVGRPRRARGNARSPTSARCACTSTGSTSAVLPAAGYAVVHDRLRPRHADHVPADAHLRPRARRRARCACSPRRRPTRTIRSATRSRARSSTSCGAARQRSRWTATATTARSTRRRSS